MSFGFRRKDPRERVTERECEEAPRVIDLLHGFSMTRRDGVAGLQSQLYRYEG